MRFWDASAVVPLIVDHAASPALFALQLQDPDVMIWWATPVECASALARRVRVGELDPAGEGQAHAKMQAFVEDAAEIEPTLAIRDRAERLLGLHPLRAADALQLAAALAWAGERTNGMGFVCLDDRLKLAAAREGFAVLPT